MEKVTIVADTSDDFVDFIETTGGKLVEAGFGDLQFEAEDFRDGDSNVPLLIKDYATFNRIRVALNGEFVEKLVPAPVKMARVSLSEALRRSKQMQLRANAAQQVSGNKSADDSSRREFCEWIKNTLDTAIEMPSQTSHLQTVPNSYLNKACRI